MAFKIKFSMKNNKSRHRPTTQWNTHAIDKKKSHRKGKFRYISAVRAFKETAMVKSMCYLTTLKGNKTKFRSRPKQTSCVCG